MNDNWLLEWTTESPSGDEDLDKKVFLTEEQMARKLLNGDFIHAIGVTNLEEYETHNK